MKKSDMTKFKKLLYEKKKKILEEMSAMNPQMNTTIKESTGDLSSYSYHMADQGTDAMGREMAFMLTSKSGRLLYHIDEAVHRIDKGEYGKCFSCGKNINRARLEAVPHARLCIECKSDEETKRSSKKK
ncbi:MAG: TraR/DksA family transcriptional regulator [Candidatus Zixiibacteriota bacterium]